MIIKTSKSFLPVIVLLTFGLTGCATTGTKPTADTNAVAGWEISYQVLPGDRLGGIAERFTGRFDNWKAIAEANDITDPRTLAAGQTITIPGSLVKSAKSTTTEQDSDSSVRESSAVASNSRSPISVTTGNGVSIARGRNTAIDENAVIAVFPVEVNRSFDLQPLDTPLAQNRTERSYDSAAPQIKVIGTYYPKGIYAEPANYARLIRRAAPGTLFPLESEVNTWYKIMTEEGVGYIRQSDSALID